MSEEIKKTYPSIPANNWWHLRKRFRTTIPKEVTPTYLASTLSVDAVSARKNVLPSLRLTGLVDKDGKPTELAVKWRDDGQYKQVCQQIIENIYPQELRDIAPDSTADKAIIQNWFANQLKVGEAAARKMTSFYFLLLDGNPQTETEVSGKPTKVRPTPARQGLKGSRVERKSGNNGAHSSVQHSKDSAKSVLQEVSHSNIVPQLHFNIQVVLPENALAETYDAIFKSIAVHLLGRSEDNIE